MPQVEVTFFVGPEVCISEHSRWIPSSGRHFNMSVVTPEKPGDLLFFIFVIAFQILSIVGGPDRSFAIGFCSRFSKMVGSIWVFRLKTFWKCFSKMSAFSSGFVAVLFRPFFAKFFGL